MSKADDEPMYGHIVHILTDDGRSVFLMGIVQTDDEALRNELRSALKRVGVKKVEVVSDTDAENGLVRMIVRSDGSVRVDIDPYAAEDVSVGEVERHVRELFNTAKFPGTETQG